jgi:hypothetical protein
MATRVGYVPPSNTGLPIAWAVAGEAPELINLKQCVANAHVWPCPHCVDCQCGKVTRLPK